MSEIENLEKRIKLLETKIDQKPKKQRKKSDYNIFVQDYITTEKKKGSKKTHRELFSSAAKEWSSTKEKTK